MKRFVAAWSAALAVGVAVAPIAATATPAHAATSVIRSVTATAPSIAVAIKGRGGALWVQADGSTPMQPLFIVTGTDDSFWMRTLTTGWQPLGSASPNWNSGPAAAVVNSRLTVACRGLYNHLWANSTAIWSAGLPVFSTAPTNLGGVLAAAPAVASVVGTTTYFVLGTNGEIYISTGSDTYSAAPFSCIGQPAAASTASGSQTIFACQGTNHKLVEAETTDVGTKWTKAVSLGGSLIGGPAIAPTSSVTELLAEGSNHAVWMRTLSPGWTSIGGNAAGGVAAAYLG